MCVIIEKNPGIVLPEEKIINACITNSDGWGLSVIDRGKIETTFGLDPNKTDPDKVLRALETVKDHKSFLHLRYTTAGSRTLENCHPFFTTTKGEDGLDILFMHNGTLASFKDSYNTLSDTNKFNSTFLKPLLKTLLKANPNDNPLNNPLLTSILDQCAGASVFTLYDAEGNSLIINKSKGKQFDGWWASNEYSFNASYRSSRSYYPPYPDYNTTNTVGDSKNVTTSMACPVVNNDATGGTTSGTSNVSSEQKNSPTLLKEAADLKAALAKPHTKNTPTLNTYPFNTFSRDSFADLAGIPNLETLCSWEYDDLKDLIDFFPEMAQLLIADLLYELYLKKTANSKVH